MMPNSRQFFKDRGQVHPPVFESGNWRTKHRSIQTIDVVL